MRRSITKKGHKLMSKDKTESQLDLGPQQIVIADRGWVWVGKTNFNGGGIRADRDGCESGMSQRGQRGAYASSRHL